MNLAGLSGAFADKNAGNGKTVTVTGGTLANGNNGGLASNYAVIASGSTTGNILQKALTVTGATAANRVYDGSTAVAVSGGTLSGLVGTETLGLSGLSGVFADKNVGTGKAVTISGASLTDGGNGGLASNYKVGSPVGLSANVTQATINTVSNIVAGSKVYDATTKATVSNAGATFAGMVNGDVLTVSATSASFADKNAGSGKTVTASGLTLGGLDAANYNLTANSGSGSGAITPKALTISGMSAVNKAYDGSTKATLSGGSVSGLVGSETVGVTGLSATFADKNAGTGKSVTATGATLADGGNGGLAANYTISNPTGLSANITPKALTVTGMTAGNKVYDGNTAATLAGGSLSGLVSGETLAVLGGSGAFADKNAGNGKAVTVSGISIADGTGLASNYTVSNPTGLTASITQKALTVTGLTADNKVYDGNTKATVSGGSLNGLVGAETLGLSGLSGVFGDKNAGAGKTVTVSGATLADGSNGGLASNYTVANPSGVAADISKANITGVTGLTADTKVYDATTSATISNTGAVFAGMVNGDALTVGATSANFNDKNAGSGKTVTASGLTLGGTDAGNYQLTAVNGSGTGTITQAQVTGVSGIAAGSKVYDAGTTATVSNAGATFAGMFNGDVLTVSATSASFADKNVGSGKTVTASGLTLGGTDAGNYNLTAINGSGTGTITQAQIASVSGITAVTKTYDGTDSATLNAGATFNGVLGSDSLSFTATKAAFSDKNAASGKTVNVEGIALGGTDAGNYTLASTKATGTGTIARATITGVTGIAAGDKVYDGTRTAVLDTSAASFTDMVAGDKLSATAAGLFADKNVATGKTVAISISAVWRGCR